MSHTTIPLLRSGTRFLAGAAIAAGLLLNVPAAQADPFLDTVTAVLETVATFDTSPPGPPLPAPRGPGTAIVVLGYGLEPDGRMRGELIDRLEAGFVQAAVSPQSPIIVTGGNPRGGVTEADAMARWLVERGIAPDRVHVEAAATDTRENAANSAALMRGLGLGDAVLVTSADHMPRAAAIFADAGVPVVGTVTPDGLPPLLLVPFGPHE
ncbi:YdcF family protein [Nocardia blacklockiae]|uniref:YdcF family protein n=1 Tax=Nocardia blacklockiae TaxID=480036 RepID=UPI001894DD19|nr:YdcF family protein [Nocardia blacklockiae]MBF6175699.1 YdcF family protein [Nocardia blacklockiae]